VKFFTHTTNDKIVDFDLEKHLLRSKLMSIEQELLLAGDQFFGHENNYPVYRGKNSFYVGRKK
jgi:hypothetical protein